MNCWHCDRPAHGVCRFCGRAVCKDHAQNMPHIVALYRDDKSEYKALVTANVLWCGLCQPKDNPIKVDLQ